MLPAQQPGPRRVLGRRTWGSRVGLALLLVSVCAIAFITWRQLHQQIIYSQIQARGGSMSRKLTKFQTNKDFWIWRLTGKTASEDPNRGVLRNVALIDPTEEELSVLNRETSIRILYIKGKSLESGMCRLISGQRSLELLTLQIPGLGDEELLLIVRSVHRDALIRQVSIPIPTTVTDAGVNAVSKLHKIDQGLHLGASKITGRRLAFATNKPGLGETLPLMLGRCDVTDATLDELLAATKIYSLGFKPSGVTYEKILATKEVGGIKNLNVSALQLTEEELLKLSRTHLKTIITSGLDEYQGGSKHVR